MQLCLGEIELDLQEVVVQVQEVLGEAAAVVAGWEATVPAPGQAGNASAPIAGRAYHIRWAIPAITGVALNVEQKWQEVKNIR